MANPARFTSGVSTAAKGTALWNLPNHDPTKVITYWNDFHNYVAGDWTITRIGTTPTEGLVTDEPGGALILTNSAADNDGDQLQLSKANFTMSAGKKAWFKGRCKISDATQSDFAFGLIIVDTTILGAVDGGGVTDGIFFSKDDGDTQIDFQVQKDASTGQKRQANIGTMTTSYIDYGWYFDGGRYVEAYLNGVKVYTMDLSATPSTYLPDAALTPSFAILNGEAVAKTLTVDYIFAAVER